ncbi:MAG: alcohol dehydrogenase catalytic domain-containing protein [Clostridiales Family XIII bacterium]|jgi:(R,R)-butanediol dehydrogenase/meso-butanediol dehydrogenase/diacetyl reductase|nr:alcohol dehydrogenase catalytic domain-containing protein [Clostridiales Family XIII bacterium]
MKAAVLFGKQDVRVEERDIPVAGAGQMVVKIEYVGICGTDVEFYKNGHPFLERPIVLGHENVGTVHQVGEGVADFKIGDRVLLGPPGHCPEDCPSCKRGDTNICLYGLPRTAGIGGPDGGYAEYMLVRDVAHTMILPVPENVDMKDAVLFDVICVSLHGIRKSKFKLGVNVVVSGAGSIAFAAIRLLKAGGARTIIAIGTNPAKSPTLKAYGADYFIDAKSCDDIGGTIKGMLGSPVGADVVFECAGNNASLRNCVYEAVRPGGQVVVIGTIQEPMSGLIPGMFSVTEPEMLFTFVYTRDEVSMYLDMLDSGKIDFPNMVTDIVSLDDCVAKGLAREDRRGQFKILIDPSMR